MGHTLSSALNRGGDAVALAPNGGARMVTGLTHGSSLGKGREWAIHNELARLRTNGASGAGRRVRLLRN
jgi:hypothetical protein